MSDFPTDKPVLITCGLPYANGKCHIGHLRTYIPADIFVRSLQKQGQETVFVCGSDTHGTPIVVSAEEMGTTPEELIEKYHNHFDEVFKSLGIHFDFFGSTNGPVNHHRTTEIVNKLIENDNVYTKTIDLAYCSHCNRFLPDRYVEGICPYCESPARGDECDQGCGRHLEPGEIREPACKICGNEAIYKEQEHFFFKLSSFRNFLLDYLETLEGTANARNYAKEWVHSELKDWCITRNLEWGVKFPGHENLVVYVWVDAPIGYISFTEEYCKSIGRDWKEIWQGDSSIIHFIGLDIAYHHCIFWPAMLKGAGYSLPRAVVASGMVKIDDKTFSKSRGYVVWVIEDYLDHGFHPDLLRYYLASYTSHTKELNFSWKVFQEKVNNELVGSLGNFLYRTLHFTQKNFGSVPEQAVSTEVFNEIRETITKVIEAMDEYEFKKAIDSIMGLANYGNTYFQTNEPWHIIKTDPDACATVVKDCLQIAKALVLLSEPVLPVKMKEAWTQLGLNSDVSELAYLEALTEIESGKSLPKPAILFEKIDDKKIEEMETILNKRVAEARAKEEKPKPLVPEVTFDEFQKMDIRVGTIVSAEPIKGSDKLLKLNVDIGEPKPRQVVAGIAQTHKPEDLLERQIVLLANMKPAKLFGVESKGMILAADETGAILLQPERKTSNGTTVR
ncbi:MAG TPA: methionine--tRNA ligase [Candidatus Nanoarchaeia archaeon]|nr:methionine--tRNA ligase [Candidatus Nanoarchaeia archaeon]